MTPRLASLALTLSLASALTLGLTLLPDASASAAAKPVGLTFTPDLASPGDIVAVSTDACGDKPYGVVYAKKLGGTVMLGPALEPGEAHGQFRVLTTALPGTYTIHGLCADGKSVGGVLRIPKFWVGGSVS